MFDIFRKHKEPKNNSTSYCSFWNSTWVFFPCLRDIERKGFRVGWFKRECYSEKLRESVIVRYWERERERGFGFRERKSRDQAVRERGGAWLRVEKDNHHLWWQWWLVVGTTKLWRHGGLVSRAVWDRERKRN